MTGRDLSPDRASGLAIQPLDLEHADAIQRLASDPEIAATTRIPHPYPENGARDFITRQLAQHEAGTAFGFAIVDRDELVGSCGLHWTGEVGGRELGYWIGRPFWGRGYASFAVQAILAFAFRELDLDRVTANALETNSASRRVLEKNGFELLGVEPHADPLLKRPDEREARYEITRRRWRELAALPAVARLHGELRGILDRELALGNEIVEAATDRPGAGGVLVRLRYALLGDVALLPPSIRRVQSSDPAGSTVEYHSTSPHHILVSPSSRS